MTPTTILHAVCQVFPVTPADITGPRRRRSESEARHLFCHILRAHTRMSLPEIGTLLNRCHHSVSYGVNSHATLYATVKQYRAMADKVTALLGINQEIAA